MKITSKISRKTIVTLSCMALFLISCSEEETLITDVEAKMDQSSVKLHSRGVSDGLASPESAVRIKYFIDSEMPVEWIEAIHKAALVWSNTTRSINMSPTSLKSNANFNFNFIEESPRYSSSPAGAEFPNENGDVGTKVDINSGYIPQLEQSVPVLTPKLREYILIHELGHVLGYTHFTNLSFMPPRFTEEEEKWSGMSEADIKLIRNDFPNIDPR
ncbi:hypothetical protein C7448_101470 [Tenacibaculum gallaicum]|uniref:Matrixin n=1 Tax=Tenacibaculum gallaicum TaxID=561505 RepID=A0A3E0ICQ9_9FLAO|nr:hypothetical protein [Tenacibaculum gallaicum]REH56431.1 hypothetical protein C7448_101470 [Tenacibaculum gallaicum]